MAKPFVRVENLNRTLYAIRRTDVGIRKNVEKASERIAVKFVADARRRALSTSQQAAATSQSLRTRKGVVPKVAVGGSGRFPSSTQRKRPAKMGDVFWGAEFGAYEHSQFAPPPAGGFAGHWFYATLSAEGTRYVQLWLGAVDAALRDNWRNI